MAADVDKIREAEEGVERASHIARLKEWFRGIGTGGIVGARMAGQAVTITGRTVAMPVVARGRDLAGHAKEKAVAIAKTHIPPVFLIITIIGHLLDVFSGFHVVQFRILLYLMITVWALFVFKEASNDILMLVVGISAWMFFAPYILSYPGIQTTRLYNFLGGFIVMFPLWPIASIYLLGKVEDSKFLQFAQVGFLIFVVFLTFPVILKYSASFGLPNAQIDVRAAYTEAGSWFTNSIDAFAKTTSLFGSNIGNWFITRATGEQYPAKTEDTKPLGISITSIAVDSPDEIAYSGEKVTILASITATTLEEPIGIIEVKCKDDASDKWVKGTIIGRGEETNIYNNEVLDINCVFGEGKSPESGSRTITVAAVYEGLKAGSRTITVAASYEFTGTATITTIFMNREQKRAIEQSGEDALTKIFPGFEENPLAVNPRNGPAEIGMRFGEMGIKAPIGLLPGESVLIKASLANKPQWSGVIEEVEDFKIDLPPGFERDPAYCPSFSTGSLVLNTETLKMLSEELKNTPKQGIEKSISFRCSLKINELQNSINSFTATAKYIYRTEARKSIIVKSKETGKPTGTGVISGGTITRITAPADVKEKIAQAAKSEGVPEDYALAIAYVESKFIHTKPDGRINIGVTNDIGIMQISKETGLSSCKDLGVNTVNDLYDIDKNIRCGVRIIKNKCNEKKCETGVGAYYSCTGETYYGWDIAARGYNGWLPCIPAKEKYVNLVNDARKGLKLPETVSAAQDCYTGKLDYFPVQGGGRFSNDWGASRPQNPSGVHEGNDIFAPEGTPVVAAKSGEVTDVGCNDLGGNAIDIQTKAGLDKIDHYYAHLQKYTVKIGDKVNAGEVIGYVGRTEGCSNGQGITRLPDPHLHFQIMDLYTNKWMNPYCALKEVAERK